ncbi:TldD/PmbA family protein [Dactylosporangium vinaceum]|uniref:TldD/PmbA family protein n=1 Tax=Dactylosporangium vinaceum TaxID=53362 RepID=A0ABV5MS34_9ACTN|nr:TldD/PmbA family protein [Dactylosporangium vinaceum]UAC00277.1 TldD/PmbA family protein [Dactylosporangium vinaceum]
MFAPVDPDRLLDGLARAASAAAADAVEIALLGKAGEYTRFAGGRVHQPQDITETQYTVRAVVDGHAARAATGVLGGLDAAVARAAELARALAKSADRPGTATIAAPAPGPDLELWHDDTAAFDAGARSALAGDTMRQAEAAGGHAAGMFGRAVTQLAVVNSNGVARQTLATEAIGTLTATVGERGAEGTSHWIDLHRSAAALNAGESVQRTVREAVAGRGRGPLPDGHYTVVLGPQAAGELLGFLEAFGFGGDLAAAGVGLVAQRAGERIASTLVHVADDATAPYGLPIGFDLEGTPKSRVPLLAAGVVGHAVTDLATARALGTASTGHAHVAREEPPSPVAANLVLSPGEQTEEELIAGVERGVYVQRFWYTRLVDRVAGTITGVSRDGCFLIDNGRLAAPVAGARFTHSVLDLLATVDGLGRTVRSQPVMNVWNGAVSAPALRGHGFRFGAAA